MTIHFRGASFADAMHTLVGESDALEMRRGRDGVWRHVPNTYVTATDARSYMEDRESGVRMYFLDEMAPVDVEVFERILRQRIERIP